MQAMKEKISQSNRDLKKDYNALFQKVYEFMEVPGLIGPYDACTNFKDYVEKEFVFRT